MRILVIEDDAETAAYIAKGLREAGQLVDIARDGRDGLFRATHDSFDLIIVDRMLPELDGLSMLKAARAAGVAAPALMLTAMGAIEDRVAGLEGGADDYLVKPFSFAELNARANALLRRPPLREEETVLRVSDLTLDRLRRIVRRGEQQLDLQPREFRLLEELMLNAGRVVTRTMLLERVWDFRFDPGTNIVETHISRIRSKIDRGGDPPLIHTLRGAGYVVRAP
ncbi:MAG: response regulator transcription factor [Hyphomonadaceae bacterium]|nr:response regulator transcription factor [Hyphomonadaceae bacterium]